MTTVVDLGKLRFYWAGDYNASTQYEINDVVRYGGNVYVYINIVADIGNVPIDTTYWALMIEGINFVGVWNSSTQYFIGDAVAYGSTVYVSLSDNINKQPDLFPLVWSQFVEGIQYEGVYVGSTTYQANDVVTYGPSAYIAKQTTNNNLPTNTVYWDSFVQGISAEGVYNSGTAYVPNNIVAYGANLYIATANTTGNIPINTSYWQPFISAFANRGVWGTDTLYYVNDLVQSGANTYACQIQNTSDVFATDLAAGKWSMFVSGLRPRGNWTAATAYLPFDIVVYGGNTYSCVLANTSSVFATDLAEGRWQIFNGGIRSRGAWTTATAYLKDDLVSDALSTYIELVDYTSGASVAADLAALNLGVLARGAVGVPIPDSTTIGKLLSNDGTSTYWFDAAIKYTAISANTAAASGSNYLVDTSVIAITLTLPAAPVVNDIISVADAKGTFKTNNLTISGNGNQVARDATLVIDLANAAISLIYTAANGWVLV